MNEVFTISAADLEKLRDIGCNFTEYRTVAMEGGPAHVVLTGFDHDRMATALEWGKNVAKHFQSLQEGK